MWLVWFQYFGFHHYHVHFMITDFLMYHHIYFVFHQIMLYPIISSNQIKLNKIKWKRFMEYTKEEKGYSKIGKTDSLISLSFLYSAFLLSVITAQWFLSYPSFPLFLLFRRFDLSFSLFCNNFHYTPLLFSIIIS